MMRMMMMMKVTPTFADTSVMELNASYACNSFCRAVTIALFYVAAKATYIRLLHGKIGILEGFFGPSSVHRGRTHIVFG